MIETSGCLGRSILLLVYIGRLVVTNFLFWNLNGNDNCTLILNLLRERDIDFAAFVEWEGVDFGALCANECLDYRIWDPVDGAGKIRILLRECYEAVGVFKQRRYTGITVCRNGHKTNVFVVHLQDLRSDSAGLSRCETIRFLVANLRDQEREQCCTDTVVIGDFNVQPFAPEMVGATLLNATFFKEVATRMQTKTVEGVRYPFMYNPTLEHFSESGANCGSFYRATGVDTFYWHCLDQAIVSPSLADSVVEYRYLREIKGVSLIGDVAPKSNISDHLPLFVTIDRSGDNE